MKQIVLKNGNELPIQPVEQFAFHSQQQRQRALDTNCTLAFDFRFTFTLPRYLVEAIRAEYGQEPILLGYTTYQSSTWGIPAREEWTWRDPFAGDISGPGATLEEAIAESYRGIPETERPAWVWVRETRITVPGGTCRPV